MLTDEKVSKHMSQSTLPGFDDHMRVTCEVLLSVGAGFFVLYGFMALAVLFNWVSLSPDFYSFVFLLLWLVLVSGPMIITCAVIGWITTPRDFNKVERFFLFAIFGGAVYTLLAAFFLFF